MYCLVAAIGMSDQQGFDQADFADAVSPLIPPPFS